MCFDVYLWILNEISWFYQLPQKSAIPQPTLVCSKVLVIAMWTAWAHTGIWTERCQCRHQKPRQESTLENLSLLSGHQLLGSTFNICTAPIARPSRKLSETDWSWLIPPEKPDVRHANRCTMKITFNSIFSMSILRCAGSPILSRLGFGGCLEMAVHPKFARLMRNIVINDEVCFCVFFFGGVGQFQSRNGFPKSSHFDTSHDQARNHPLWIDGESYPPKIFVSLETIGEWRVKGVSPVMTPVGGWPPRSEAPNICKVMCNFSSMRSNLRSQQMTPGFGKGPCLRGLVSHHLGGSASEENTSVHLWGGLMLHLQPGHNLLSLKRRPSLTSLAMPMSQRADGNDENGWKWMKMDENGWKWMKMDENASSRGKNSLVDSGSLISTWALLMLLNFSLSFPKGAPPSMHLNNFTTRACEASSGLGDLNIWLWVDPPSRFISFPRNNMAYVVMTPDILGLEQMEQDPKTCQGTLLNSPRALREKRRSPKASHHATGTAIHICSLEWRIEPRKWQFQLEKNVVDW